ncbi:MAG: D-beta-D-heptose 7-phosphate kinase/D-beta-D-heptose 1-phosphate adenosyltransferase [Chlamydiales bacterium]
MIDALTLEGRIDALGHPHVLIIGDLILDRYVMGEVARISPEAPIPVLRAQSAELRLGGAGNVAANLRSMEAQVEVIAVVGDDGFGRALAEKLTEIGVSSDSLVVDVTRPTIEKTRMISGSQQMLRVDWEDARPIDGEALEALLACIAPAVERAQAVVLSDYGKGALARKVIERAIACARERGIPVLVDPKGEDYSRYRGATLISPNKKEAEQAIGRSIQNNEALPQVADELIALAGLESVVITLGADGIYHRTAQGVAGHDPARARAVFDVVGAGDTVVAQMALYLADGLDLMTSVALANHAAGIVVGRLGAVTVTRSELRARITESLPITGKVLDHGSLDAVLEGWRREGRRIVFTNGCFDVLHVGHVDYLRFARAAGDVLIVGVNDDASVSRLKGPERPVNTLQDRMKVLAALEMVEAVVSFAEDTPAHIIERVTPDVLVKGEDWRDKGVVGSEWVESHGGRVLLAPLVAGRSTTSTLERIRNGGVAPERA